MKLYSALIKKNDQGKIIDVIFLKDGFSCAAFLFSGLWFLYHKMYKEVVVLLVVNVAISFFVKIGFFSEISEILLQTAFIFMVALNANQWFCDALKKREYKFAGMVFAPDLMTANSRFIKNLENDFGADNLDFEINHTT